MGIQPDPLSCLVLASVQYMHVAHLNLESRPAGANNELHVLIISGLPFSVT